MSDLVVPGNTVSEALARSRELVADAVVLHARARELSAKVRRRIEDHRYLLGWVLPSWELATERSSYLRLDDAVIRDFARYGGLERRGRGSRHWHPEDPEGLGVNILRIQNDAGELKVGAGGAGSNNSRRSP